jgi:predicted metal-dependent peptidase
MYHDERFYAELMIQMDRIISDKVPTLGVCVKDNVQLYVNQKFFDGLTETEQVAVLKHECQHILNNHIERSKELAPDVYAKKGDVIDSLISGAKHELINIACDCAINDGIKGLPQGGCHPKDFKLEPGHTMEWYVEHLKDNKKLKGITHVGDHSLWGESDGEKEEIKEKIKKIVENAAQKTRAAGKMSSEDELLIERMNYKPKDWRGDLKRFAARSLETVIESSKKKRNRRYGIMYPGSVKHEELHIGVAIDTSGSISDEALCQFMAEIGNIAKYATVTVVEADSEVKASYLFDPKKTYKVKGRGGTAYQPAFDYFTNNTDVDGVIYLGDMDCFDKVLTKPKYPVLWAIIGNQAPPAAWGSITKVEVTRGDKGNK